MDTQLLTAFIEVARQQSFSLAADALFLTQPAVSKRVQLLEQAWGVILFNRINRSVSLTEAGRLLLPKAQAVLKELEEIRRFTSSLRSEVAGSLAMGTSHHIGLHRLPPVLKAFNQTYPHVNLDLHFVDSEQALEAVERGELEIAVLTLPLTLSSQLQAQTLWIDHLSLVVHPEHPLASQQAISLQELVTYPCVLPNINTYTYHIIQHALQQQGLKPLVRMHSNYLETLKMLVVSGFGWSLLPHTLIDNSLVALNCDLQLTRSLGAVTHLKRVLSNPARAMLNLLADYNDEKMYKQSAS